MNKLFDFLSAYHFFFLRQIGYSIQRTTFLLENFMGAPLRIFNKFPDFRVDEARAFLTEIALFGAFNVQILQTLPVPGAQCQDGDAVFETGFIQLIYGFGTSRNTSGKSKT